MSKVMSILEKHNLVKKVEEEKTKDSDSVKKHEFDLIEAVKSNIDTQDEYTDEAEVPKPELEPEKQPKKEVKEKPSIIEINNDYQKNVTISEIYSLYGLKNVNVNTVFMLQDFVDALPNNLPQEVIKQSVMGIIKASNINVNELISDGEQRLKALETVRSDYDKQTNKSVNEYKNEIDKLTSLINDYKNQIKIKENILDEQTNLVKYETQKIGSIIEFFRK